MFLLREFFGDIFLAANFAAKLFHPGEHVSRIHCQPLFRKKFFDPPAFWRTDFVLHFHRFHNQQSLPHFDRVSFTHQNPHNFSRHGRGDLLAPFHFECAVPSAAPHAWVAYFRLVLREPGVHSQRAIGSWSNADLVRLSVQQNAKGVRRNFRNAGIEFSAVQRDSPFVVGARQFHHSRFAGQEHVVFHGRRSICRRRPSRFHSEGCAIFEFTELAPLCVPSQTAAETADASASLESSRAGGCGRCSNSSSHLVWISALRKSGSARILRNSAVFVLIPVMEYSSRARRKRAMVSSRLLPHAINLLSSGS